MSLTPFPGKKGSAYLIALGVTGLLVITVFLFSRSSINRRGITKFIGDEGKAEAIAEAAVDIALLQIRDNMNTPSSPWYRIFRMPGRLDNNGDNLAGPDGKDLPMTISAESIPPIDISADLAELLAKTPGSATVELRAAFVGLNAFGAMDKNTDYHVAGINRQASAIGNNPAKFLESFDEPSLSAGNILDDLITKYTLNLRLPNNTNEDSAPVKISLPWYLGGDDDATVHFYKPTPISFDTMDDLWWNVTGIRFIGNYPGGSGSTDPADMPTITGAEWSTAAPNTYLTVTYDRPMGAGVTTPANYTITGSGKGSLAEHPGSVTPAGEKVYCLTWTTGSYSNKDEIQLEVNNVADTAGHVMGDTTVPPGKKEEKVWESYIREYFEPASIPEADKSKNFKGKTLAHVLTGYAPANAPWDSYTWTTERVADQIKNRFNGLPSEITTGVTPGTFQKNLLVEKAGYLRLIATVNYKPHDKAATIRRVLVADRDFKVADIQPVAPEYVFFVSNSMLPYENPGVENFLNAAGDLEIKLVSGGASTQIQASASIHPFPKNPVGTQSFEIFDEAFSNDTIDDKTHLPGMVRLNGTKRILTNVFLGTLEEINTTEYNMLLKDENPDRGDVLDPRLVFTDASGAGADPAYRFRLPYLAIPTPVPDMTGIFNMMDFLKPKLTLDCPTLFFGDNGLEYPLSLGVEGFLFKRYSWVSVALKLKVDGLTVVRQGFEAGDRTKVHVGHTIETDVYGMVAHPPTGYDKSHTTAPATLAKWNPGSAGAMPPYLYSSMQYAKKAAQYFQTGAEFLSSLEVEDDTYIFNGNGVTFVKDSLVLDKPLEARGRGLLVVYRNIELHGNITRSIPTDSTEPQTVFGLMARTGAINVKQPGVDRIEAACFSNYTLQNPAGSKLVIDGNLVMNHFDRTLFNGVEVYYNGPACRPTLLSMMRKIGKFEPERYSVSVGKQWARYSYERQ